MTISCDLLFNLPGQKLEQATADVRRASELGFDQICI
jgi:coproporphyrinogen III oxidase-like Fe-S oxidoreductase